MVLSSRSPPKSIDKMDGDLIMEADVSNVNGNRRLDANIIGGGSSSANHNNDLCETESLSGVDGGGPTNGTSSRGSGSAFLLFDDVRGGASAATFGHLQLRHKAGFSAILALFLVSLLSDSCSCFSGCPKFFGRVGFCRTYKATKGLTH